MASLFIILIAFGLVSVSLLFGTFFSMTFTVISILFLYRMVSNLVQVTNSIDLWKGNIKKLENVKHLELTKE